MFLERARRCPRYEFAEVPSLASRSYALSLRLNNRHQRQPGQKIKRLTGLAQYPVLVGGIRRARSHEGRPYRPSAVLTLPSRAGSSICPVHHLPKSVSFRNMLHMCVSLPESGSSNGLGLERSFL